MNVNSSIIFATFALVFHIWWVVAIGEPAEEMGWAVAQMMAVALLILVAEEVQKAINWITKQIGDRIPERDTDA